MVYEEGRVFLTPLRFDADVCCQVNDRSPAAGDCEQIGNYLKCFACVEVLYGDIVQSAFFVGSRV